MYKKKERQNKRKPDNKKKKLQKYNIIYIIHRACNNMIKFSQNKLVTLKIWLNLPIKR